MNDWRQDQVINFGPTIKNSTHKFRSIPSTSIWSPVTAGCRMVAMGSLGGRMVAMGSEVVVWLSWDPR